MDPMGPDDTPRDQLRAVLDATRDAKLERALELSLDAWRAMRHERLATLVQDISDALREPPVERQGHRNLQAAFDARATQNRAADVGPLLHFVADHCRTSPGIFILAVGLARSRPADPRISAALVRFMEHPPFRSKKGSSGFAELLGALEQIGDPRGAAAVIGLSRQYRGKRNVLPWLGRRGMPLLHASADRMAELPPAPELPQWAAELCDRIDEALQVLAHRGQRAEQTAEEILARIYAEPEDTALRLVLADLLQEQGDPRGEFIALQCARAEDATPSRQERALLKAHERLWLGELDPVILRGGVVYRRGFLAACRYRNEQMDINRVGHPAWATVEELDVGAHFFVSGASNLLLHPVMRALRVVRGLHTDDLKQVQRHEAALPWTTLGLARLHVPLRSYEAFVQGGSLPSLTTLDLGALGPVTDPTLTWLFGSPLGQRLTTLRIPRLPADWASALRLTSQLAPGLQQLEILAPYQATPEGHHGWLATFTRGPRGLSRLHATHGRLRPRAVFAGLTQGLAQLPADALDAIVVQLPARARGRTTGGAELQRAVARFRHLERCELPEV